MDIRLKLVTSSLDVKGGAHRVTLKIAQHFKAPIYCFDYQPEKTFEEFQDIEIITPKKTSLRRIPVGRNLVDTIEVFSYFYNLKLDDYDLINAHISPAEWVRNKNSPVLWYCYAPYRMAFDLYDWKMKQLSPLKKLKFKTWIAAYKYLEFKTIPEIEYMFTVSNNSKNRIKKYLKRDAETLYPGIETNKFSCKGYEKFFFYPSRIDTIKEFEYVIKAFKIFSAKTKGWKLVIAGSTSPFFNEYLEKLKSISNENIIIETNIEEDHLLDLYSRCYAVPFSAIDEDLGLVPLEALASSKPVIARNEGGTRETVAEGNDGFLVNSPEEMAQKMEWLAKNPDACEKMGKLGRKKVCKDFTWENFLKRFEEKAREMI